MTTAPKRLFRARRRDSAASIHPDVMAWFIGESGMSMAVAIRQRHAPGEASELESCWRVIAEGVIKQWIAERPGKRPRGWWVFDAPERRRRVGGRGELIGDPALVSLGPTGLPDQWPDEESVRYHHRGGTVIDPLDPPQFEAQASLLKRCGLFLPGEAKRLRPVDFEPEPVRAEPGRSVGI